MRGRGAAAPGQGVTERSLSRTGTVGMVGGEVCVCVCIGGWCYEGRGKFRGNVGGVDARDECSSGEWVWESGSAAGKV